MKENIYFETIKCEDYEIFNLDFHNKRVTNTIGLNINLQEYIYPLSEELLRCKVTYNDSEVLNVEYFPYKKREINSFKLIFDDEINYSKKYLNREKLDSLFLQKENCDEIIIIKNGIVIIEPLQYSGMCDITNLLGTVMVEVVYHNQDQVISKSSEVYLEARRDALATEP